MHYMWSSSCYCGFVARFELMCKQNNVSHISITCPSSASQQLSGLTTILSTRGMPKQLIPAGWVEKPCRYFNHESTASSCGFCHGDFAFWNGRQHCHFCGHQFHRRRCSRRIRVDGWFSRRRICPSCDYYRNVAREALMQGLSLTLRYYSSAFF